MGPKLWYLAVRRCCDSHWHCGCAGWRLWRLCVCGCSGLCASSSRSCCSLYLVLRALMYFASQGKLSISVRRSADNSPLLLRFAARGDCIGESALVVPASRTVTGMFHHHAQCVFHIFPFVILTCYYDGIERIRVSLLDACYCSAWPSVTHLHCDCGPRRAIIPLCCCVEARGGSCYTIIYKSRVCVCAQRSGAVVTDIEIGRVITPYDS